MKYGLEPQEIILVWDERPSEITRQLSLICCHPNVAQPIIYIYLSTILSAPWKKGISSNSELRKLSLKLSELFKVTELISDRTRIYTPFCLILKPTLWQCLLNNSYHLLKSQPLCLWSNAPEIFTAVLQSIITSVWQMRNLRPITCLGPVLLKLYCACSHLGVLLECKFWFNRSRVGREVQHLEKVSGWCHCF